MEPGERVLLTRAANRTQSPQRAVGGKLFVTNRRLLFACHRHDASTGGKDWAVQLAAITEVDVADRKLAHWFGGGVRRRLRVGILPGEELFVVSHPDDVAHTIADAAAAARGATESRPPSS